MAYQTGTATSVAILLEKLKEFAQAQSWTINKHNTTQLYLSNTDGYWALEFKNNFLFTIACTGFDNSRDAFNQPGSSANAQSAYREIKTATTHLENGNFVSYDFFGTNQYLHVVVQIEAERFRHFGIGSLIKEGNYTGGQYAFGTYLEKGDEHYNTEYHNFGFSAGYNNFGAVIRADGLAGETKSPWYFSPYKGWLSDVYEKDFGKYLVTLGRAAMYESMYTIHPEQRLVIFSQSKFGQGLIPCPHSLIAHCKDGIFRRLGILPDRFECTMNGIAPRQVLTILGERWMIIPSARFDARNARQIERGLDNSGIQGVAYRIIE
ncbi:hypothetical protein K7G92_000739 [Pasteurella canis]|uniref:hypothetical protein n=1 Tax=Pasteurella canis TaxID=753 RepID=UPI001E423CAA|nr:hypothetical protein [Pasteurella canis]UEA17531.1 hypothetical protein K7G92_000739 [Pasteurella canis]